VEIFLVDISLYETDDDLNHLCIPDSVTTFEISTCEQITKKTPKLRIESGLNLECFKSCNAKFKFLHLNYSMKLKQVNLKNCIVLYDFTIPQYFNKKDVIQENSYINPSY
jgi:hypothetical protein